MEITFTQCITPDAEAFLTPCKKKTVLDLYRMTVEGRELIFLSYPELREWYRVAWEEARAAATQICGNTTKTTNNSFLLEFTSNGEKLGATSSAESKMEIPFTQPAELEPEPEPEPCLPKRKPIEPEPEPEPEPYSYSSSSSSSSSSSPTYPIPPHNEFLGMVQNQYGATATHPSGIPFRIKIVDNILYTIEPYDACSELTNALGTLIDVGSHYEIEFFDYSYYDILSNFQLFVVSASYVTANWYEYGDYRVIEWSNVEIFSFGDWVAPGAWPIFMIYISPDFGYRYVTLKDNWAEWFTEGYGDENHLDIADVCPGNCKYVDIYAEKISPCSLLFHYIADPDTSYAQEITQIFIKRLSNYI